MEYGDCVTVPAEYRDCVWTLQEEGSSLYRQGDPGGSWWKITVPAEYGDCVWTLQEEGRFFV